MRQILFFNNGTNKYKISSHLANYIYFHFYVFCTQNEIYIDDVTIIKNSQVPQFKVMLEDALAILLTYCHENPTSAEKQKDPNRFEDFSFREKKYTVNYRLSCNGYGNVAFALFHLIDFINNSIGTDLEVGADAAS